MDELDRQLGKCVRCGACKSICPTYLETMNETLGARGRVAMLGALQNNILEPTPALAEKIFSCMLCGACRGKCPTGIDIPEMIYRGRSTLVDFYGRSKMLKRVLKKSSMKMDNLFSVLRKCQRLMYGTLFRAGKVGYVPEISSEPFHRSVQVYKNSKKIGRVAIYGGCSVNYFYPRLGHALVRILLSKGYEVVVFKGELCCGAPIRSMGLEQEAVSLARKNIEHFNKVRAEAVISMCPTCTHVFRDQYPLMTGDSVENIKDVNEFFLENGIAEGLEISPARMTFHDPCHLGYGLGIKSEPRAILGQVRGIELHEMRHPENCCGFAGLFSLQYREMSDRIAERKMQDIAGTAAETVVTSCPGCIMQLEGLAASSGSEVKVRHIVEILDEAMHPEG